jgi:transposase
VRYSNDLRNKVVKLLESGKKQMEIAKFLGISGSSVARRRGRYKRTGTANYALNRKSLESDKINDLDKFREFINKYCDRSLFELRRLWINYRGDNKKASYGTIRYVIVNKLGYAFKRNLGCIEKETKS